VISITVTVRLLRPLLADRGLITKQISMFPGVRTQAQTKMFSVFYEMSLLTAAASVGSLFHARGAAQRMYKVIDKFTATFFMEHSVVLLSLIVSAFCYICCFVMAALCNRAIMILLCGFFFYLLLSIYLSFFSRLISAVTDWM